MESLETIKNRYYVLAQKISAPSHFLRFHETPQDDGSPYLEFDGSYYSYIITERGEIRTKNRTRFSDELLYWIISDLTREMALNFELNNRNEDEDFRRQYFRKDIEFLEALNPEWAKKRQVEHEEILYNNPFS